MNGVNDEVKIVLGMNLIHTYACMDGLTPHFFE